MAQVKKLVITGYGTNCERECAFAADQAGSNQTTIAYFSDLTADKVVRFLPPLNFSENEARELVDRTAPLIKDFLAA